MKSERCQQLIQHVFQQTGGFQIDGWRLRSPVHDEQSLANIKRKLEEQHV
ncbi:hypothetical protein [Paenibacillus montaniterrae]|nr:hypothetical protein [Paenibacillus montaniterrae]